MTFDFIDEITELSPGESAKARTFVFPDAAYFEDHFAGFPVVPGVLLTEMMGQCAAKTLDFENKGRGKAILAKILSATFRDWVRPGQQLEFDALITLNRPQFAKATCQAKVEGKIVGDAELFFTFIRLEDFNGEFRDRSLEAFRARSAES